MKQITILLFKDRGAPVGRYQIPVVLIERWKKIAIVVGIVLVLGIVDYVRARLRTWELDQLRKEASTYQHSIEDLQASMKTLNGELDRLHELERKMRIIANVPGAPVGKSSERGVGGDDEEDASPAGRGEGPSEAVTDGEKSSERSLRSLKPTPNAPIPDAAGIHGDATSDVVFATPSRLNPSLAPSRLLGLQQETQRLHALAESRSAAFADLLEQLHAQSDRLASTPSIWPTHGWLTSTFGGRVSPFTGQWQSHGALDIAGPVGTDIIAPSRGRVIFVGVKPQLGNCLIIQHGYGIQTTYGHTSRLFVKVGEMVERGDLIAKVGNSGRSTGPHLHYAIAVNGKPVDPLDYILD